METKDRIHRLERILSLMCIWALVATTGLLMGAGSMGVGHVGTGSNPTYDSITVTGAITCATLEASTSAQVEKLGIGGAAGTYDGTVKLYPDWNDGNIVALDLTDATASPAANDYIYRLNGSVYMGATGTQKNTNIYASNGLWVDNIANFATSGPPILLRGRIETPANATLNASGVIAAIASGIMRVDTYGAGATDDLVTLPAGSDGQHIILVAKDDTHTVVVKNGTGNIDCGADFSLDSTKDAIALIYSTATISWLKVGAVDNG